MPMTSWVPRYNPHFFSDMFQKFKKMELRTQLALGLAFCGVLFFIYGFTGQQEFRLVHDDDVYKVNGHVHSYPDNFHVQGWIRYSRQETLDSLTVFFKAFDDMCQKEKLEYWCTSGTLLGVVRHGGMIPWDDDLDVAMTRKSAEKLMKLYEDGTLLKKYGFEYDPGVTVVTKIKFADQGWFPSADIYISEEVDEAYKYCLPLFKDGNCSWIGSDWWPREYVFKDDLFPLRRINFEGYSVNVPHNHERVVRQFWGDAAMHEGPPSSLYSIHTAYSLMKPMIGTYYLIHPDKTPFFLTDEARERLKREEHLY